MDVTVFEHVASALTVRSICTPLGPVIPANTDIPTAWEMINEEALEIGLDPMNSPGLVVDSGRTIGILWLETLHQDATCVTDLMDGLGPDNLLSSDTNILEAVHIFADRERPYFFILEGNKIVGVLFYDDLFKPLGRLTFLALALEIEELALNVCQARVREAWSSLSENRKEKAREEYEKLNGRPPENKNGEDVPVQELIRCTAFADKATMIWKCKVIPGTTRKYVLGFFNKLKKIRNLCAHPGNEYSLYEELPVAELSVFLKQAQDMRAALSNPDLLIVRLTTEWTQC